MGKKIIFILAALITSTGTMAQESIHQFNFVSIDGDTVQFSKYAGKKILIVNTASECGYTPQYEQLQEVHEKYGDKVVVIGFPANNYGAQEPGNNQQIKSFCSKNYGVGFMMASKLSVDGEDIDPVFQWLTTQDNPSFTGRIKWNFEKFLLDEKGVLIARFRSSVKPNDPAIVDLF